MADSTANFEADTIGAAPKGWTATKTGKGDSKWTIEQDKTAPSKVVKQSGRATYPLFLKEDTNIKDGFIQIKFKAVAGAEDRAGGVVWRARDANNYYVARANALEDNVVLYKTVEGGAGRLRCRRAARVRDLPAELRLQRRHARHVAEQPESR